MDGVTTVTDSWRWSHDPSDPCSLCVAWEQNEDDQMAEGRPVWPDGSTVPLVFNRIHNDCLRDAIDYSMSESEARLMDGNR